MIRHLTLENWKAYRRLDLDLDPTTTFVIAKNGIGKTSLFEGAMWALFGEFADIDPATCVRAGSPWTNSTVYLELNGQVAQVSRTFSLDTGKTETALTLGEEVSVGDRAVLHAMEDAFGAEPAVLARMSFLREGEAVSAKTSESASLRAHLDRAFGVDALVRLASAEETRQRQLIAGTRATRKTQRLAESERSLLRERVRTLDESREQLLTRLESVRETVSEAQNLLSAEAEWSDFDSALVRQRAELAGLIDRARAEGVDSATDEDILAVLADERNSELDQIQRLSSELGHLEGELSVIADFRATLDGSEGKCPVCLRPVAEDELHHAQSQHASRIDSLRDEIRELEGAISAKRVRVSRLEAIQLDAGRSVAEREPPRAARPNASRDDIDARLSASNEEAAQLVGQISETTRERDTASQKLDDDTAAIELSSELFRGYREQALSELTAVVLQRTAESVVTERINPLSTEIRQRWKSLWPDRAPIELLPDGSLVAVRGEHEVPYREFSGGEKVMATVIVRLLALSMTTTAPFLWLDEPLEHLDPRNRRMVASLLTKASQGTPPRQIVATTYEEAVARRLDETNSAQLVYVEAEPIS